MFIIKAVTVIGTSAQTIDVNNNVTIINLKQQSIFSILLYYNINTSQARNVNCKLMVSSPTNTANFTLICFFNNQTI